MTLRAGSMEIGLRRSALQRIAFDPGLMGLCPPQSEYWIGTCDMTHLTMTISDEALMAASDDAGSRIELRLERELVDPRLRALATAVEVERTAGFPSGGLFLDAIEQALARALVLGYAVRNYGVRVYRGGLSPARLRKIKELVQEKMEEDLSLEEMARTVGLSTAHFSQVFRNTTGQTPYQYLLWYNVRKWRVRLRSAPRLSRQVSATRPARRRTSISSGIGSSEPRRCCVPPKCACWMLPSPAASKRSSTLLTYSAGCAEAVRRNTDTNPCAENKQLSVQV